MDVNLKKLNTPIFLLGKTFSPTGHRLNETMAEELKTRGLAVFEDISHDMMLQDDWEKYARIIEGWLEA